MIGLISSCKAGRPRFIPCSKAGTKSYSVMKASDRFDNLGATAVENNYQDAAIFAHCKISPASITLAYEYTCMKYMNCNKN